MPNKRKRALNDDDDYRPIKRLASSGSKKASIENIPNEIFDEVLGEVALAGNERSAAKNLTSIESVGKGFQKALRASPAGKYHQSLSEAGKAAKTNYTMLPRGKFREGGPVAPYEYVDMVGPGIHLLSSDEQSKVVDKVLGVGSSWRRAHALNKMASYAAGLSDDSRLSLLDSAIELIEQPDRARMLPACKAVAKMHDYRTDVQEARIARVRNNHPLAATTIDGELDAIRRQENTPTVENTPGPPGEARRRGHIPVKQRVRNAAEDVRAKVRQADAARVDLRNTTRERDGRG